MFVARIWWHWFIFFLLSACKMFPVKLAAAQAQNNLKHLDPILHINEEVFFYLFILRASFSLKNTIGHFCWKVYFWILSVHRAYCQNSSGLFRVFLVLQTITYIPVNGHFSFTAWTWKICMKTLSHLRSLLLCRQQSFQGKRMQISWSFQTNAWCSFTFKCENNAKFHLHVSIPL